MNEGIQLPMTLVFTKRTEIYYLLFVSKSGSALTYMELGKKTFENWNNCPLFTTYYIYILLALLLRPLSYTAICDEKTPKKLDKC